MVEQNDRFSADNVARAGFWPANRGRQPTPSTSNTAVEIASEMDSHTARVRDDIAVASGSAQRRGKPTHQKFGRRSWGGATAKSVGRMAAVAVPLGYRSRSISTVNGSVPNARTIELLKRGNVAKPANGSSPGSKDAVPVFQRPRMWARILLFALKVRA
jgi:hypothetical protein